jgi:plasmid stabilization system protein ParE
MKRCPVSLREEARLDIKEIHAWYEKQRKGLGAAFRNELEERITLLRRFPKIGLLIQENARRVLLKRFPYIIVYRFVSGKVIIEGVFHAHRDRKVWWERI